MNAQVPQTLSHPLLACPHLVTGTEMETTHENKTSRSPSVLKFAFSIVLIHSKEIHSETGDSHRVTLPTAQPGQLPVILGLLLKLLHGTGAHDTYVGALSSSLCLPTNFLEGHGVCLNSVNLSLLSCTMEPVTSALPPSPAVCEALATSICHILQGTEVMRCIYRSPTLCQGQCAECRGT